MSLPPNFSPYMVDLVEAMMRDIGIQTIHCWSRYVILIKHDGQEDCHVWLVRDEFEFVDIAYMSSEPTSFGTDEPVNAVVGMIKAAME